MTRDEFVGTPLLTYMQPDVVCLNMTMLQSELDYILAAQPEKYDELLNVFRDDSLDSMDITIEERLAVDLSGNLIEQYKNLIEYRNRLTPEWSRV